jgi:hypothetical protein
MGCILFNTKAIPDFSHPGRAKVTRIFFELFLDRALSKFSVTKKNHVQSE